MVRIHCICLVRDESDVVRHTLDSALKWAHSIHVIDNGSTDGTWELLEDLAGRDPKLHLTRQPEPFRNSMRGELANSILSEARRGDWWCRLDADEIYIDDPRRFLARVPSRHSIVYSASLQYYFTDRDLSAYEASPQTYTEQWEPGLLRYYSANWSEPRFVRHTPGVLWTSAWPDDFKQRWPARKRIRLQHFQYRSPPQIQRRLQLRLNRTEATSFQHEKRDVWLPPSGRREDLTFPGPPASQHELWKSRIVNATSLHRDDGNGTYIIDESRLPPLWHAVGTPMPLMDRVGDRLRRSLDAAMRRTSR